MAYMVVGGRFFTTHRGVYNFDDLPQPHPSLRLLQLQPLEPQHMGPQPRELQPS